MQSDTYLTRETLLKRLQFEDDDLAWEEFSYYYRRFIFSIIKTIGVRVDDIDDLVQRVMVKIWKSIPEFNYDQKQGSFRSWLYQLTKNATLNFVTRDKSYVYSHAELKPSIAGGSETTDLSQAIEEEWRLHLTTLAFENISKSSSENALDIFKSFARGESIESIAQRLDMKEDTVVRYKNRIKQKMVAEVRNLRDMLE